MKNNDSGYFNIQIRPSRKTGSDSEEKSPNPFGSGSSTLVRAEDNRTGLHFERVQDFICDLIYYTSL